MYIGATGKRIPRVCLLRSAESSSPDNASIVARLDGNDSGEASLGIIRFVPISSPSRPPSAFSFVDYYHLCRYRFYFYSSHYPYSSAAPSQFLRNRTIVPSPQEEPKDLGKHGYRIEQRHFATGRKSRGNLKADVYTSKRKLRGFLLWSGKIRFKISSCVNHARSAIVI